MAVLEVQAVSKRFGGLQAVAQASLRVEAGSIPALIGPNGAGKTTLFSMISGFVRPDSGSVTSRRRASRPGNPKEFSR